MIEANPSSTSGVITIMDKLNQYVPVKEDGTPIPVIVHGDQLSVERMFGAKKARSGAQRALGRFEGQVPSPQEFHKQGLLMQVQKEIKYHILGQPLNDLFQGLFWKILMQICYLLKDMMDELFSVKSARERGTLYQIKQAFGRCSLKGKVMANYNNVWDFIQVYNCLY